MPATVDDPAPQQTQTEDSPLDELAREVAALRSRQAAYHVAILVLAVTSGPETVKRFKRGMTLAAETAGPPGAGRDFKAVFGELSRALDDVVEGAGK